MRTQELELTREALYRQIGEINVLFQHLENELLEIEWFCTDAEALKSGRRFVDIVKDTQRTVNAYLNRAAVPQEAPLRSRFARAFTNARAASKQRNRTIHSTYYWHEVFHGSPPVTRTFTERGKNGAVQRKVEAVTPRTIESTSDLLNSTFDDFFGLHRILMYELRPTTPFQERRPTPLTS